MNGADKVNMGTNGIVFDMKENPKSWLWDTEDKHVSYVHSTNVTYKDFHNDDDDHGNHDNNNDDNELPIRTVHANDKIEVPSGRKAEKIKEFIEYIMEKTW